MLIAGLLVSLLILSTYAELQHRDASSYHSDKIPQCPFTSTCDPLNVSLVPPGAPSNAGTNCSGVLLYGNTSIVVVKIVRDSVERLVVGESPVLLCLLYEFVIVSELASMTLAPRAPQVSSTTLSIVLGDRVVVSVPTGLSAIATTRACVLDYNAVGHISYERAIIPFDNMFYAFNDFYLHYYISDTRLRLLYHRAPSCLVDIYYINETLSTGVRRWSGGYPRAAIGCAASLVSLTETLALTSDCADGVPVLTNYDHKASLPNISSHQDVLAYRRQSIANCVRPVLLTPNSLYTFVYNLYRVDSLHCRRDAECSYVEYDNATARTSTVCVTGGCDWTGIRSPLDYARELVHGASTRPLELSVKVREACLDDCPRWFVAPYAAESSCACDRILVELSEDALAAPLTTGDAAACSYCDQLTCVTSIDCIDRCMDNPNGTILTQLTCQMASYSCPGVVGALCLGANVTHYNHDADWYIMGAGMTMAQSSQGAWPGTPGQLVASPWFVTANFVVNRSLVRDRHVGSDWGAILAAAYAATTQDTRLSTFAISLSNTPIGEYSPPLSLVSGELLRLYSDLAILSTVPVSLTIRLDDDGTQTLTFTTSSVGGGVVTLSNQTHSVNLTVYDVNATSFHMPPLCASVASATLFVVNGDTSSPVRVERRVDVVGDLVVAPGQSIEVVGATEFHVSSGRCVRIDGAVIDLSRVDPSTTSIALIVYNGTCMTAENLSYVGLRHCASVVGNVKGDIFTLVIDEHECVAPPPLYAIAVAAGVVVVAVAIVAIYIHCRGVRRAIAPHHDRAYAITARPGAPPLANTNGRQQ